MHSYPQRVRDAILPLSVGDTLPKAFGEWYFTGATEDHDEPCETCELCGQEGLRYHFEICNEYTRHTLQVGSHCILQFNVAVFEDGKKLSPREAKKKLDKLTQMRLESCIKALERLAHTESSNILRSALDPLNGKWRNPTHGKLNTEPSRTRARNRAVSGKSIRFLSAQRQRLAPTGRNRLRQKTNFTNAFNAIPPVQPSREKYSAFGFSEIDVC
jgi:hypothetical protein